MSHRERVQTSLADEEPDRCSIRNDKIGFYFFSTIKPIKIKSNSHLAFSSIEGFDKPCRISHQLHQVDHLNIFYASCGHRHFKGFIAARTT